jgi:uncharacterized protein
MKIALFGASGTIGQRILEEALARGHEVTALVRNPARLKITDPRLSVREINVLEPASVTQAVTGHDIVISAIGPASNQGEEVVVETARSLLEGASRAEVPRLLVVGGAGSLEVAPGVRLMDTPDFPAAWKGIAQAHADALAVYQREIYLNWTYVSPAAFIESGQRTGKYRVGTDQLLADAEGKSYISAEDFAVAVLDEVEHPRFDRQRFTVAY